MCVVCVCVCVSRWRYHSASHKSWKKLPAERGRIEQNRQIWTRLMLSILSSDATVKDLHTLPHQSIIPSCIKTSLWFTTKCTPFFKRVNLVRILQLLGPTSVCNSDAFYSSTACCWSSILVETEITSLSNKYKPNLTLHSKKCWVKDNPVLGLSIFYLALGCL